MIKNREKGRFMETIKPAKNRIFMFLLWTYVFVFALNILNSTVLNMALQVLATNVSTMNTLLPQIVYYLMSVLAVVWQFVSVGAICLAVSKRSVKLTLISVLLFMLAVMAHSMLPIFIAAVQYSSQSVGSLIAANADKLFSDVILNAGRAVLALGASLVFVVIAEKRKKTAATGAVLSVGVCAVLFTLVSMGVIFFESTLPFLASAGRNAINSQLPKILAEYFILALYGVIGYAVGTLYIKLAEKTEL